VAIVKSKFPLSKAWIKRALELKSVIPPQDAITQNHNNLSQLERDYARRQTEVRWFNFDHDPELHDELMRIAATNQLRLGVSHRIQLEPGMQLSTYYEGHHFDWHFDGHPKDQTRRVLSMSVLLTADFAGGELEFKTEGAPRLKKPGDVILFNSSETHRVAPVTRGVRDTIVCWFGVPR
jgi:predicted 2-oxoglutarate/Fe(II)-dependent dioxygenase YbiX